MNFSGSYESRDVTFLLRPVQLAPTPVEEKERLIQSGKRHYRETHWRRVAARRGVPFALPRRVRPQRPSARARARPPLARARRAAGAGVFPREPRPRGDAHWRTAPARRRAAGPPRGPLLHFDHPRPWHRRGRARSHPRTACGERRRVRRRLDREGRDRGGVDRGPSGAQRTEPGRGARLVRRGASPISRVSRGSRRPPRTT